jgi:hypothetical protein
LKPIVRLPFISSSIGALVALVFASFVSFGVAPASGLDFISVVLVLFCPPWELFWGVMGSPKNGGLLAALSLAVVLVNSLIYAPIGLTLALSSSLRPWAKYASTTAVALCSLALGHLFFVL